MTGAGATGGGDVILVNPATIWDIITIERDIPIERLVDYSVGGDFSGLSINQQLDKLTMTQQQNEMVNEKRQLTYLPTDELAYGDVNLPKLEINQIWTKSAAGGLIAAYIEESTGWSTLRSELANELMNTDGSRIVGYYSTHTGSVTVHDAITAVVSGSNYYAVTSGTPNAYTETITGIASYFGGLTLDLRIHQINTGACQTQWLA